MDFQVFSSYHNGAFYTAPEYDNCHTVYTDLDHKNENANENTQFLYDNFSHHVGTLVGIGCGSKSFYGRDSSWDSLSQPEEMDQSLEDVRKVPTDGWRHKHVQTWTSFDIMNWVIHEIKQHGQNYENCSMKTSEMTGETLCNMSREEFEHNDPNFGGMLYDALQLLKSTQLPYSTVSNTSLPSFSNIRQQDEMMFNGESVMTCLLPKQSYPSDVESESSQVGLSMKQKRPDRPGRPPTSRRTRKQEKKTGRLWEFIRDLLKNREYCPSLICWENYEEGVFRFVRSDKVAELWGTIKENPRMTYEKLSRAMRYYYKSKVLLPVLGRRLVYKFGPTATDWHTPNPNFRLPE